MARVDEPAQVALCPVSEHCVSLRIDDRLFFGVVAGELGKELTAPLARTLPVRVRVQDLNRVERPPNLAVLAEHDEYRRDHPGSPQWWEEELLLEVDVPAQGIHRAGQLLHARLPERETREESLDAGFDLVVLVHEHGGQALVHVSGLLCGSLGLANRWTLRAGGLADRLRTEPRADEIPHRLGTISGARARCHRRPVDRSLGSSGRPGQPRQWRRNDAAAAGNERGSRLHPSGWAVHADS